MEDFKALNLEELEDVAGGFSQDQLTSDERARLRELSLRASQGDEDFADGKISEEERDRLYFEWELYSNELRRKYN